MTPTVDSLVSCVPRSTYWSLLIEYHQIYVGDNTITPLVITLSAQDVSTN
jgi:hypothetical protein